MTKNGTTETETKPAIGVEKTFVSSDGTQYVMRYGRPKSGQHVQLAPAYVAAKAWEIIGPHLLGVGWELVARIEPKAEEVAEERPDVVTRRMAAGLLIGFAVVYTAGMVAIGYALAS